MRTRGKVDVIRKIRQAVVVCMALYGLSLVRTIIPVQALGFLVQEEPPSNANLVFTEPLAQENDTPFTVGKPLLIWNKNGQATVALLGSASFIFAYSDHTRWPFPGKVMIGSANKNSTITLGAPYQFSPATQQINVATLDSSHVIIYFVEDIITKIDGVSTQTEKEKVVIGNVTGASITFSPAQDVPLLPTQGTPPPWWKYDNHFGLEDATLEPINQDQFLLSRPGDAYAQGNITIGTLKYPGPTITFSAGVPFPAPLYTYSREQESPLVVVNPTRFFRMYSAQYDLRSSWIEHLLLRSLDMNNDELIPGPPFEFLSFNGSDETLSAGAVAMLDSDRFVLTYGTHNKSDKKQGVGYAALGRIMGSTFSFGPPSVFSDSHFEAPAYRTSGIIPMDSDHFILGYKLYKNNQAYISLGSIINQNIVFSKSLRITDTPQSSLLFVHGIDQNHFLTVFSQGWTPYFNVDDGFYVAVGTVKYPRVSIPKEQLKPLNNLLETQPPPPPDVPMSQLAPASTSTPGLNESSQSNTIQSPPLTDSSNEVPHVISPPTKGIFGFLIEFISGILRILGLTSN